MSDSEVNVTIIEGGVIDTGAERFHVSKLRCTLCDEVGASVPATHISWVEVSGSAGWAGTCADHTPEVPPPARSSVVPRLYVSTSRFKMWAVNSWWRVADSLRR